MVFLSVCKDKLSPMFECVRQQTVLAPIRYMADCSILWPIESKTSLRVDVCTFGIGNLSSNNKLIIFADSCNICVLIVGR